mmetsp:Transcript_40253/g.79386  ORF Transcript_40253/g.79386 Transcript_40253/m.79386 type:complete len:279 (-) Transcript_40253:290-1126(-)
MSLAVQSRTDRRAGERHLSLPFFFRPRPQTCPLAFPLLTASLVCRLCLVATSDQTFEGLPLAHSGGELREVGLLGGVLHHCSGRGAELAPTRLHDLQLGSTALVEVVGKHPCLGNALGHRTEPVVAHQQDVRLAALHSLHQSGLLVNIVADALPLVHGDFVVEVRRLLGKGHEAILETAHRYCCRRVKMDNGLNVGSRFVHGRVDDVGGDVVGRSLVKIFRGDLIEEATTRGDEEPPLLEPGAHVVPHQFVHAELSGDVVGSREVFPLLPLVIGRPHV